MTRAGARVPTIASAVAVTVAIAVLVTVAAAQQTYRRLDPVYLASTALMIVEADVPATADSSDPAGQTQGAIVSPFARAARSGVYHATATAELLRGAMESEQTDETAAGDVRFEVVQAQRSPIVEITVRGSTADSAVARIDELVGRASADVGRLQKLAGVPGEHRFGVHVLRQDADADETYPPRSRIVVVVVALSLAAAAGLALLTTGGSERRNE